MKKTGLRIAWIIPNVFMYLTAIGLLTFIVVFADGLIEINRFAIYVVFFVLLMLVNVYGSFRIATWIKQGKL